MTTDEIKIEPHLEWRVRRTGNYHPWRIELLKDGDQIAYEDVEFSWSIWLAKRTLMREYRNGESDDARKVRKREERHERACAKHSGPVNKPKRRGLLARVIRALRDDH